MKTTVRIAVAAAILAASAVAAPAFADTALPSTGNGEAVLYVRNVSTDTVYVRGLGETLDQLLTQTQIAGSGYSGTPIVESGGLASLTHDAALASFLGASPTLSNFQWAVLGGDSIGTSTTHVKNAGELRYVTTTQVTMTGTPGVTNQNLNSVFSNLGPVSQSGANGAINSGVAGDKASGVGAAGQIWTPHLSPDPTIWYGNGLNNVSTLGSSANLYMLATNGGATGTAGTNLTQAAVFQFASLTLNASGDLVGVSSVPLPAAVWLFGSGLLGLAGIGRRRSVTAVAA
jgi:hypothetical protein